MYIFFRPQTFCLDIGSIMTYILVVWLDNSITSAPLTPTCVHYSLKSFVCYSIFGVPYHSVPHFIPPLHTGAAFSSLAFSTPAFLTVPHFPFSHFQSPRCDPIRPYSFISSKICLRFCRSAVPRIRNDVRICRMSIFDHTADYRCIAKTLQVRQQDAYPANVGGGQLQQCATSYPLSRATFPSLIALHGIDNDVFARLPNITSTFCDLELWPPDPCGWPFMPVPLGRFVPICIEIDLLIVEV